eukprot:CAMPEP_0201551022 /NCGR_PEP_ID=MMETSP0173_2-20130828/7271_1 /ASSEMBLY_ACC=CAM_ASM_000268 /TAXON_ID=218659 /ORGANISM="Vexillifera sp., Strain DIVA3 564/2" /LENGTH=967 /DNA_ID=CAMNT_0047961167 /DNA_START=371 /DNA_END=3274 /DNA_ORIENTATION=-
MYRTFEKYESLRHSPGMQFFHEIHLALLHLLSVVACLIFCSAGAYWMVEKDESVESFHQTIYFIFVTFSTVGYGDISPSTDWGQFVIIIIITIGIIIIPYQISELSELWSSLPKHRGSYRPTIDSMLRHERHVVVSGHISFESFSAFIRDFFHSHHGPRNTNIVILSAGEPEPLLLNLIRSNPMYRRRIKFLEGSTVEMHDLRRVRLLAARAFFVIPPPTMHVRNEFDSLWISSSLAVHYCHPCNPDFSVFTTLHDHSKAKYLDELQRCITLPSLLMYKSALISYSGHCPGFTTLINSLITPSAPQIDELRPWVHDLSLGMSNDFFTARVPDFFVGQRFHVVVSALQTELRVIAFAVIRRKRSLPSQHTPDPTTATDAHGDPLTRIVPGSEICLMNPSASFQLRDTDRLVCIGQMWRDRELVENFNIGVGSRGDLDSSPSVGREQLPSSSNARNAPEITAGLSVSSDSDLGSFDEVDVSKEVRLFVKDIRVPNQNVLADTMVNPKEALKNARKQRMSRAQKFATNKGRPDVEGSRSDAFMRKRDLLVKQIDSLLEESIVNVDRHPVIVIAKQFSSEALGTLIRQFTHPAHSFHGKRLPYVIFVCSSFDNIKEAPRKLWDDFNKVAGNISLIEEKLPSDEGFRKIGLQNARTILVLSDWSSVVSDIQISLVHLGITRFLQKHATRHIPVIAELRYQQMAQFIRPQEPHLKSLRTKQLMAIGSDRTLENNLLLAANGSLFTVVSGFYSMLSSCYFDVHLSTFFNSLCGCTQTMPAKYQTNFGSLIRREALNDTVRARLISGETMTFSDLFAWYLEAKQAILIGLMVHRSRYGDVCPVSWVMANPDTDRYDLHPDCLERGMRRTLCDETTCENIPPPANYNPERYPVRSNDQVFLIYPGSRSQFANSSAEPIQKTTINSKSAPVLDSKLVPNNSKHGILLDPDNLSTTSDSTSYTDSDIDEESSSSSGFD